MQYEGGLQRLLTVEEEIGIGRTGKEIAARISPDGVVSSGVDSKIAIHKVTLQAALERANIRVPCD